MNENRTNPYDDKYSQFIINNAKKFNTNTTSTAYITSTTSSNTIYVGGIIPYNSGSISINTTTQSRPSITTTDNPNWFTTPYTNIPSVTDVDWNDFMIPSSGGYHSTIGYSQTIFEEPFLCYSSSEGRIREGKRELVFKLLQSGNFTYDGLVKHLGIEETLFNTLLLEYALKFSIKRYMELMARKSRFTKHDLFLEVINVF